MTLPPPKIINILDAVIDSNDVEGIELATQFDLDRISIRYVTLPQAKKSIEVPLIPKINLIGYLIDGEGTLSIGNQSAKVKKDDCFSFAACESEGRAFILTAEGDKLGLVIVTDVNPQEHFFSSPPEFPMIVPAASSCTWRNKGKDMTKDIHLVSKTDMGQLNPLPWGLVREHIPPDCQSSNAHCHSAEDELVIILQGKARYWYQGVTPEPILKAGDCVGWKAGTGICHTLLNDAKDETGEGEPLIFLVWGERKGDADKLFYATTNPPWWNDSNRWFERPILPQGPASGLPTFPLGDDAPYPS